MWERERGEKCFKYIALLLVLAVQNMWEDKGGIFKVTLLHFCLVQPRRE